MSVSPGASEAASEATSLADRLAFTLWLPAAVAAALSTAVGRVLAADDLVRWAVLAASGSFVVYGIDRLRDLERDRHPSPRRTAFIERNQRAYRIALAVAGLALALTALGSPLPALALCGATGGIGLFHRRLKRFPALKSLYVSVAWTGICVGLPWLAAPTATTRDAVALSAILFPTFWANLVASNLRDDEAALDPTPALGLARSALILALAATCLAPATLAPLAWVPTLELLALARFRPTEHYGHLAVDGALLAGGLAAVVHLALT